VITRETLAVVVRVVPTMGICINITAGLIFLGAAIIMKDAQYGRRAAYWLAAAVLTTSITY